MASSDDSDHLDSRSASQVDSNQPVGADQSAEDQYLIRCVLAGEASALQRLIERYDRLVRFTIFKASRHQSQQDPFWVDSVASEAWTGFVRSMERRPDDLPSSVSTYLIQVARNRTIDAIRSRRDDLESLSDDRVQGEAAQQVGSEDPSEIAASLDELSALRTCVDALSDSDQRVYSQLDAISSRRWREAGEALGMPESTLRSRWRQILGKLQACMEKKTAGS